MTDGRQQAWWREYSDVIPDSVDVFLDYESGASVIRTYAPMVLPGLLQTEAYATRLLSDPARTADARAGRQARAGPPCVANRSCSTTSTTPRGCWPSIDEAAVRRALAMGTADEARAQLEHLRRSRDGATSPSGSCRSTPDCIPV